MDALLQLVRPTDRPALQARARRLSADAVPWMAPVRSQLSAVLRKRLSITVAAIAPDLDHAKLSPLVRYSLWCYLLDDHFDTPGVSSEALCRVADRVRATLRGAPPDGTFLTAALAGLLAELRGSGGAPSVLPRFADALCDGIAAAVEHATLSRRIASGSAEPPTAAEYLGVASRHVHYRSFALALLLLIGEVSSAGQLDRLDRTLGSASRAVRLANDLCTVGKDRQEGSLNILGLRASDGANTTRSGVERQLAHQVDTSLALLADAAEPGLNASVRALETSLRLAVGAYRITDFNQEELWSSQPIPAPRGWSKPVGSPSTAPFRASPEIH